MRDDLDELLVVLAHAAEQLDLVLGDELQAVQVVAELVELAQGGVEGAVLGDEQRGGHAVELARRVVLELAIGGDLALELHQVFGPPIHLAEDLEADRAEGDQQEDDDQERGEELGVDVDGIRATRRGSHGQEHRSRAAFPQRASGGRASSSSGSNRTPMYCTRSTPSRSMSDVRNVWSTSPRAVFRANTP